VIAVEVGQEDCIDRARLNTAAMHVREQRRPAIEEQAPVDDHCPVVPLRREGSTRTQKS
jgi:hypothetical protein